MPAAPLATLLDRDRVTVAQVHAVKCILRAVRLGAALSSLFPRGKRNRAQTIIKIFLHSDEKVVCGRQGEEEGKAAETQRSACGELMSARARDTPRDFFYTGNRMQDGSL